MTHGAGTDSVLGGRVMSNRIRNFFLVASALAGFALLAAACGGSTATGAPAPTTSPAAGVSIKTATLTVGGQPQTILTDARGLALYLFTPEKDGKVKTSGTILEQWHALLLPKGTAAASADPELPGKVGVTLRPDGTRQVTYDEWPLYTFVGDKRPGDVNGQGVGNQWFAVQSVMPPDADGDADGTVPAPAAPTAAPAPPPAPVQAPTPPPAPAFNDGDGDNRGGPSDGDGNG